MLVIDGEVHEFQALPLIFFGRQKPLAYVVNPKAASTASHNFIFYVNRLPVYDLFLQLQIRFCRLLL